MKNFAIFILTLIFSNIYSQENPLTINVINSGDFDGVSKKLVEDLINTSKLVKKRDVKIVVLNPYEDFRRAIIAEKNGDQLQWNQNNIKVIKCDNAIFKKKSEFYAAIKDKYDRSGTVISAIDTMGFNLDSRFQIFQHDKIKRRSPVVKRLNEKGLIPEVSQINIILLNGFPDYKYSKERFLQEYNRSRSIAKGHLIPKLTNVIPFNRIRPKSSIKKEEAYSIRFDSVGYYDGYEIEITRTSNGKLLYSDVILFNQDYDDKKIQSINQAKTCEILLAARMLANRCYSIFTIPNLDNIPDTDKGCDLCALKCLYNKSWCIRLRGVIEGLAKDDLWTEEICNFELQCPLD